MKKIWIVTELFYPDETSTSYILSKIANKLVEKYQVNVITGSNSYQKNKGITNDYFELNGQIELVKVSNKDLDKNNLVQRSVKLILLTIKLSYSLWKRVKKDDKVFIVTNPAPLLIALALIKKIKKFELFILVHDVFPENTIPAGIINSESTLIYRLIAPVFNWAYTSADSLIVLGRDMKDVLVAKTRFLKSSPKIEIIENWGDTISIIPYLEETTLINSRHLANIITIQYAGNIGRLQGLNDFVNIFKAADNKCIHLDLWGEGAIKDELCDFVKTNQLSDNVSFFGVYSRNQQNEILNSTDISLITLNDGMFGLGVPSKAYNILASGKPILYIGELNSEIALMIKEHNIGYCFDPKNISAIEIFLKEFSLNELENLKIMGIKARRIAETMYSEKIILDKYISII